MIFDNLIREDGADAGTRPCTGTVHSVLSGKVRLIVAGETSPTEKYYKCAAGYAPTIGDRVYFARLSDSYLVLDKF